MEGGFNDRTALDGKVGQLQEECELLATATCRQCADDFTQCNRLPGRGEKKANFSIPFFNILDICGLYSADDYLISSFSFYGF